MARLLIRENAVWMAHSLRGFCWRRLGWGADDLCQLVDLGDLKKTLEK